MANTPPKRIVGVGIIGCGEVAQVVHIPTLSYMSSWFRITYLCDVSDQAMQHCAQRVPSSRAPKTTRDAAELCASPEVDVVLVINSDEYHAAHAVLALQNDKHVFVEKPLALTRRDIASVIAAERASKGKVMVGYMRRYATAFEDAIREIGGLDKILYARVRDILGPNAHFVSQSGTFPEKFSDFRPEDTQDKTARATEQVQTALEQEIGVPVSALSTRMWRVLGGLGSHDLSLMREALGVPEKVVGSSLSPPFWKYVLLLLHLSFSPFLFIFILLNSPASSSNIRPSPSPTSRAWTTSPASTPTSRCTEAARRCACSTTRPMSRAFPSRCTLPRASTASTAKRWSGRHTRIHTRRR